MEEGSRNFDSLEFYAQKKKKPSKIKVKWKFFQTTNTEKKLGQQICTIGNIFKALQEEEVTGEEHLD